MTAKVYVFARQPELGKVKTRLAADIGEHAALEFYRETLGGIITRLASHSGWEVVVAVTPDDGVSDSAFSLPAVTTEPQGGGDLGARMARFLARATPTCPVMIVGSDLPALGVQHVQTALDALAAHDLVLGPSPDGGYWLVGASCAPPAELFNGVRWSTGEARADTLRNASKLTVALVDWLEDVDDIEDYRRRLAAQAVQDAPPSTQNLAQ